MRPYLKIFGPALAGILCKRRRFWLGLLLPMLVWHTNASAQVSIEIDSALVAEVQGEIVLELEGDWTNNGVFVPGDSSTVIFFGNTASTITNPNGETFNNLIVDKSGAGLVLNNSVTVADTLALISGQIDNSNNPVILAAGATLLVESGSFESPPLIGTAPEFVLLADSVITINGPVSSAGNIHSNHNVKFKKGNPSIYIGNLTAVTGIKIDKDNTIDGDATAGGKVNLKDNAAVTGTITENAAVAAEPLPNLSFTTGGANVTVEKNEIETLAPGSFGEIKVEKQGTLELSAGEYFFDELDLKDNTTLSVDITAGPVTINTAIKLHFHKNSQVAIISPFGSATTFVTFNSLTNVNVHEGAQVLGSINSNDKVRLHKNVFFKGSISAKDIVIDKDCTFLHHTSGAVLPSFAPAVAEEDNRLEKSANADALALPTEFQLGRNYPNPFNPSTTIAFAIPEAAAVTLAVYNIRGQLINTLYSGQVPAGRYNVVWDGTDSRGTSVASGFYVYHLRANDFVATRKLLFAK